MCTVQPRGEAARGIAPIYLLRHFNPLASPPSQVLDLRGVVDLSTLATLFGLTIVTGMLSEVGLMERGAALLQHKCDSPWSLLLRVVAVTTISSALFTNDAAVRDHRARACV